MEEIYAGDIETLSYNQLIGIVKETNRPPGGKNSVFEIVNRLHLSKDSKILEIGTSTGFTSIEISRLIKCSITAIDINEQSLKEARGRARSVGYANIKYLKADVNNLPFNNEAFDVVIVGNVLSLLSDKEKALGECVRVCKKDGFIVVIPMYYLRSPPKRLIEKVSNAIKADIKPQHKSDLVRLLSVPQLETYWSKDFKFNYIEDNSVKSFVTEIMNKPHLKNINNDVAKKLGAKYEDYMFLFRDNLSFMGFTIFILSKRRIWEDPELFTSEEI